MGIKFFGQFLLERKVVNKRNLLEALSFQNIHNLKLGEMGMALGLLTKEDISRIHLEQRSNDRPFGLLAVKFGILTEEDLEAILEEQKKNRLSIGQILVRQSSITESKLESELKLFHEEQKQYERVVNLPDTMQHKNIIEAAVSLTASMCMRISAINIKIGSWAELTGGNELGGEAIMVPLSGMIQGYYFMIMPISIAAQISTKLFNEYVSESDKDFCSDAMKEFANIIAGNIISKVSTAESTMDIAPPEVLNTYKLPPGHKGVCYTFYTAEAQFESGLVWKG